MEFLLLDSLCCCCLNIKEVIIHLHDSSKQEEGSKKYNFLIFLRTIFISIAFAAFIYG